MPSVYRSSSSSSSLPATSLPHPATVTKSGRKPIRRRAKVAVKEKEDDEWAWAPPRRPEPEPTVPILDPVPGDGEQREDEDLEAASTASSAHSRSLLEQEPPAEKGVVEDVLIEASRESDAPDETEVLAVWEQAQPGLPPTTAVLRQAVAGLAGGDVVRGVRSLLSDDEADVFVERRLQEREGQDDIKREDACAEEEAEEEEEEDDIKTEQSFSQDLMPFSPDRMDAFIEASARDQALEELEGRKNAPPTRSPTDMDIKIDADEPIDDVNVALPLLPPGRLSHPPPSDASEAAETAATPPPGPASPASSASSVLDELPIELMSQVLTDDSDGEDETRLPPKTTPSFPRLSIRKRKRTEDDDVGSKVKLRRRLSFEADQSIVGSSRDLNPTAADGVKTDDSHSTSLEIISPELPDPVQVIEISSEDEGDGKDEDEDEDNVVESAPNAANEPLLDGVTQAWQDLNSVPLGDEVGNGQKATTAASEKENERDDESNLTDRREEMTSSKRSKSSCSSPGGHIDTKKGLKEWNGDGGTSTKRKRAQTKTSKTPQPTVSDTGNQCSSNSDNSARKKRNSARQLLVDALRQQLPPQASNSLSDAQIPSHFLPFSSAQTGPSRPICPCGQLGCRVGLVYGLIEAPSGISDRGLASLGKKCMKEMTKTSCLAGLLQQGLSKEGLALEFRHLVSDAAAAFAFADKAWQRRLKKQMPNLARDYDLATWLDLKKAQALLVLRTDEMRRSAADRYRKVPRVGARFEADGRVAEDGRVGLTLRMVECVLPEEGVADPATPTASQRSIHDFFPTKRPRPKSVQ